MRFIWDSARRAFVPPDEYRPRRANNAKSSAFPTPFVAGDIPEYISPATGKPITSRSQRREDLKRSGCREVDPSEFKPEYNSAKMERKYSKRARELARS